MTPTVGEKKFYEFKKGMSGVFYKALFEAGFKADPENLQKLAAGFPDEMAALYRFKSEDGYWENLCARMQSLRTVFEDADGKAADE